VPCTAEVTLSQAMELATGSITLSEMEKVWLVTKDFLTGIPSGNLT
jgi:hypothetical protein